MMVAGFLTPLRVEKIGPQRWRLVEPLRFYSTRHRGVFTAPVGFETNFASIPRVLWSVLPPVDVYDAAAVMHDAGYAHALVTEDGQRIRLVKPLSDHLFYEGLRALGVNLMQARLMYFFVRAFGNQQQVQATRQRERLSQGVGP
jgi:hypothetical protein